MAELPATGTVSFWVNPQFSQNDNAYHILFEDEVSPGANIGFTVIKGNTNDLYAEWDGSSTHTGADTTFTPGNPGYSLPQNAWSNIQVTWTNGGTMLLYLNGAQIASSANFPVGTGTVATVPWVSTSGYQLSLGNRASGGYDARSIISRSGVWNRILNNTELNSLVGGALPSTISSGLVIEYDLTGSSLAAQAGGGGTLTASSPIVAGDPSPLMSIPYPNSNIYLSPDTWRVSGSSVIAPIGGAYQRFAFTGSTTLALNVDTTVNNNSIGMPLIKTVCNSPTADGVALYTTFPNNNTASTTVSLYSGLNSSLTYTCLLQALGGDETQTSPSDGWTGTVFQTKINGLQLDQGATLSAPPLRAKRAFIFGASYEQAYFGGSQTGPSIVDASLSWPFFVCYALQCEYGQVGVGSQGWVQPGNGGYPAFPSTWNQWDSSHAKTFTGTYDYVFERFAENDRGQTDSAVTAAVTAWIGAARTTFGPSTKIFIILSTTAIKSSAIQAGVTAAADSQTYVIPPVSTEFQNTIFSSGNPATWASQDGLHLSSTHNAGVYGTTVVMGVMKAINPKVGSYAFSQ